MDDIQLSHEFQLGLLSPFEKNLPLVSPDVALLVEVTPVAPPDNMKKKNKKNPRKKKNLPAWGVQYKDPGRPGSLGGLQRFARAQKQTVQQVRPRLEKELAYTLHKPVRRRFPTLPVMAMGIDHQWVADLVEVQRLARYNGGIRYLLTVIDVLSKYAWVVPLKNKAGSQLVRAFETILKTGRRRPHRLQTDRGK